MNHNIVLLVTAVREHVLYEWLYIKAFQLHNAFG